MQITTTYVAQWDETSIEAMANYHLVAVIYPDPNLGVRRAMQAPFTT
jgi:hypothetical protein